VNVRMLAGSNTLGWTERFGVVCILPAPSCSNRRVSGARVFREGWYALALPYLWQQYILRSGEPRAEVTQTSQREICR
jgi:hypothetical protein